MMGDNLHVVHKKAMVDMKAVQAIILTKLTNEQVVFLTGKCVAEDLDLGKELAQLVVKEFQGNLRQNNISPDLKYGETPPKQYMNDLEFVITSKYYNPGFLPPHLKKKEAESTEDLKLRVEKFMESCSQEKYEKIGEIIEQENADEKGFYAMYDEVMNRRSTINSRGPELPWYKTLTCKIAAAGGIFLILVLAIAST